MASTGNFRLISSTPAKPFGTPNPTVDSSEMEFLAECAQTAITENCEKIAEYQALKPLAKQIVEKYLYRTEDAILIAQSALALATIALNDDLAPKVKGKETKKLNNALKRTLKKRTFSKGGAGLDSTQAKLEVLQKEMFLALLRNDTQIPSIENLKREVRTLQGKLRNLCPGDIKELQKARKNGIKKGKHNSHLAQGISESYKKALIKYAMQEISKFKG